MIDVKFKPMGEFQTNCYIVNVDNKEFIIDPGIDATKWVMQNVTNPIAILNTHGHFDHVWSNAELQKELNIPLYAPKDDAMMLKESSFFKDLPPSFADFEVDKTQILNIEGIEVKFLHFPGHTPGCSVIEIGDFMFSGDFIFKRSIGRYDFAYSNAQDMLNSLKEFKKIDYDKIVYPGHGEKTTIKDEQKYIDYWIESIKNSL